MLKRISRLLAFGLGAVAQSDGPKVVVNLDGSATRSSPGRRPYKAMLCSR
jgi:hypothetical protein